MVLRVAAWLLGIVLLSGTLFQVEALPVIPGAVGYGMETPAGRGGEVYRVTNLNPSGPGSLKACIDMPGPRVCIFDVSGTIELTSDISIYNPYITIAGQTAPSPGITIKGATLWLKTHDVLIQHLRFRTGDSSVGPNPENRDAIKIAYDQGPVARVVLDHNSFSWAVDELVGTWTGVHEVTFHKNIFSEALYDSVHPKGPHSMGPLFGAFATTKVTMYGNLMAHNSERNPLSRAPELVMVNNVVYNWKARGTDLQGERGLVTKSTVVGNYYKAGPDSTGPTIRMLGSTSSVNMTPGSKVYMYDNFGPNYDSANPWSLVSIGWALDASFAASTPPVWHDGLILLPHAEAYEMVLNSAGARPADRDAVDIRVIDDVRNGTGRIINSQDDVGGWPQLAENRRTLALPEDPSGDADGDGYTNLEEWLHQLDCEVGGNCPPGEETSGAGGVPTTIDMLPEVPPPALTNR